MWQLLTIARPAEAAEARWDEIDFDANEWKIPAARMKMNRDHTVPLSNEALYSGNDEVTQWWTRIYLSQSHQTYQANEQSNS